MIKFGKNISLALFPIASNVWLLTDHQNRRFLIDTGHNFERLALNFSLKRANIRMPGDLTGILLTHRHSDHCGNADWLKKKFQCPVYCHENDAPFLLGQKNPPPLKRGAGNAIEELLCGIEDKKPTRVEVDETFQSGSWKFGFEIFPAFGHTEGSVMIYHKPTKILFSGDVFLSGLPLFRTRENFSLAVACFSNDIKACHLAVTKILSDPPEVNILCSGHGPVVIHQTQEKIKRFAKTLQPLLFKSNQGCKV